MLMFEVGKMYKVTNPMRPKETRVAVVVGRCGNLINFGFIGKMRQLPISERFELDREFVQFRDEQGARWNISAGINAEVKDMETIR